MAGGSATFLALALVDDGIIFVPPDYLGITLGVLANLLLGVLAWWVSRYRVASAILELLVGGVSAWLILQTDALPRAPIWKEAGGILLFFLFALLAFAIAADKDSNAFEFSPVSLAMGLLSLLATRLSWDFRRHQVLVTLLMFLAGAVMVWSTAVEVCASDIVLDGALLRYSSPPLRLRTHDALRSAPSCRVAGGPGPVAVASVLASLHTTRLSACPTWQVFHPHGTVRVRPSTTLCGPHNDYDAA